MDDLLIDPDELRDMADEMDRTAEGLDVKRAALLEEIITCRRDATNFRQRAEMIENRFDRHVVTRLRGPRPVTPRELDRIVDAVKRLEPAQTGEIATEVGLTPNQARDRLKRLEQDQRLVRRGLAAGTTWWTPEGARDATVSLNAQKSYKEWVRDVGFELGTFTIGDVEATGLSRATVTRWLAYWVEERDTFERVDVDGQAMYAVKEHAATPVNREQRPAVEDTVPKAAPVRGGAVAGTGRVSGVDPDVRMLIADARAAGAEVVKTAGNHFQIRKDGKVIGSMASTPSDHRSIPNSRAALRRNGLKV